MKFMQKLTSEQFARPAARVMKSVCYLVIGFYVLCTALSFMGRQTFFLHSKTGVFERAICAETNHDSHPRAMTVHMGDDIHVWTNQNDQIDTAVQIGLSLMFAVHMIPAILAFCFLSRVFQNVQNGQIFTEQNAACLLYFGLLQFLAALAVPCAKLLICWLVNLAANGKMSIATGQAALNMLVPGIGFVVAAYIIQYGVRLQDEADHTI